MYYPIYRYTVRFTANNIAVYTVDKSVIMDNPSSIGAVVGGGFFPLSSSICLFIIPVAITPGAIAFT